MEISRADYETHVRLMSDYPFFARHVQKINPKDLEEVDDQLIQQVQALTGRDLAGKASPEQMGMIPLIFHPGQAKLHFAVEDQLKRTRRVRKALVKPRQIGWSTYIQGRAHWYATKTPGMKVFIVSHNAPSTKKFLRRVKAFCDYAPSLITPGRNVDNANELIFGNGATYGIATAGTPDALRSDNCHFLHASEVPFWPAMLDSMGAVIPTLSDAPGSQGFLESTSKGKGNPWHQFILETLAEQNEWEVFFDAWYNHPKYKLQPPEGWQPDDEALEVQERFRLSIDQLYWRAMKIKSLRALWMFKQEYPATVEESFQSSADTLYDPDVIERARKTVITADPHAPLIMGVDPARNGDRTVIAFRQGNVFHEVRTWPKMDDMRLVGIIATFLRDGYKGKRVAKCFIDYAIGEGAASRLRELRYHMQVQTVHFGETPFEDRYANKRIEMAIALRDWLGDRGDTVKIPDDDDVASDLLAIPDFMQTTGSEKLKLPPKEIIKKEYGKSPDIFDAMILTFAYPVAAEQVAELYQFAKQNLSHLPASDLGTILSDFSAF